MYAVISKTTTQLPPGTLVRMPGTWQDYQFLCASRQDGATPRIRYRDGEIILMSPLPKHGRDANILADIVKVLLDHQGQNYEAFTPITMELPQERGIEPDYCFYIDNWRGAVGKDRINWQVDPPPDLVIEIDVTHYTNVEDYVAYRVPEVWLLRQQGLQIHHYQWERYQLRQFSRYFPGVDLLGVSDRVFQQALTEGTGAAIRTLRQALT
jgi:Uma2 family endonuclease